MWNFDKKIYDYKNWYYGWNGVNENLEIVEIGNGGMVNLMKRNKFCIIVVERFGVFEKDGIFFIVEGYGKV